MSFHASDAVAALMAATDRSQVLRIVDDYASEQITWKKQLLKSAVNIYADFGNESLAAKGDRNRNMYYIMRELDSQWVFNAPSSYLEGIQNILSTRVAVQRSVGSELLGELLYAVRMDFLWRRFTFMFDGRTYQWLNQCSEELAVPAFLATEEPFGLHDVVRNVALAPAPKLERPPEKLIIVTKANAPSLIKPQRVVRRLEE